MIANPVFRTLLGIVLGACAGFSLCLSILPVALSWAGAGDQILLGRQLMPVAIHAVLVWAVGGWAVTRTGLMLTGGIVLGVVGLLSAPVLVFMAFRPDATVPMVLIGAGAGAIYGFLGGLILGRILAPQLPEEDQ